MMNKNNPVVTEQSFNVSRETLWNAITDEDQMREWFFPNIPSFKPEIGFETEFNVQSEARAFLHQWKVTEVIPKRKITLSWKYGGYEGESFVTFEILEESDRIKLRLTHAGIESFPDGIPEFRRESCEAGWHYFINEQLVKYLK